VRPADYGPDILIDLLHGGASVCGNMNLVGHRCNTKNFRTELKHVVTQYFVRHEVILGVEDANDVSLLKKIGSKVAQSKMPIAISMSLKIAFGCKVQ